MNRKYSGFTLVEMLIVMGIIIILMVVGITAGRFAINRANDVAHKNAVDQIYTSLQAFYTDEREYPSPANTTLCPTDPCTIATLVGDSDSAGTLVPYIDLNAFDGGSAASYFYDVGGDGGDQAVLVCVTLRGPAEENNAKDDGEVYCNGNGLGDPDIFGGDVTTKTVLPEQTDAWANFASGGSEWDNGWVTVTP